jgi:tRNA A-37 threonylcarbamoyl transferase component Bud32
MTPAPGALFADRYAIQRELGQGGMATVFLARDQKHHREVALKVLRQDLAAAVGSERFLREIEITASLNHPHILPLLDSGTFQGLFFYVMPYVAGGSLRRLISGEIPVPLEAVLRIVREVASCLDYAHARGVIHRDIKPENILFNEGLAVVSDFGIARAVSDAQRDGVTRTGLAVGTPGYMSPEQALATGSVDARADVYALGSVVYELLTGGTPASWPGPEDVKLGRLTDLPGEHRLRLDRFPGRIEQVLAKALALRPTDRFQHAGDLARALEAASERTPSFSEEQVRQLLDRAAELQAKESDADPDGALTMGGVEQVAAQVGIPPEHVRQAARELVRKDAPPVPRVGGDWRQQKSPKFDRLVAERVVDGEIPDSAFPKMVEEIQRHLDLVGHASVLGGTLTWSPAAQTDDTRKIVISVTPRQGKTVIRLQESLEVRGGKKAIFPIGAAIGLAFGVAIAAGLGMGEPAGPIFTLLFAAGGIASAYRTTISIEAGDRGPQLQALALAISEIGEEEAAKKLGQGTSPI